MKELQQAAGKKAGMIMMVVAWLLGMVLAVKYFSSWDNPNQTPSSYHSDSYVEVTLQSGPGGHYIANGYINNSPVTFMLDTGATHVAISRSLAEKLNLKKGYEISLQTANGESRGWKTNLETVRLGDIELHNVPATIAANMDGDVLLGMSFLRALEFTQRNNQLTLRQYKR